MTKELCKVVAIQHITLDGVYQAPGRPDEDTRDGFEYGGWAANDDPEMQKAMGAQMSAGWSLLVGRTTYEQLYEGWHVRQPDSPMTQALTGVQKFVASHKSDYKLPWQNSKLLAGDATETVARLKKEHDKKLVIFGSGVLMRSLMAHDLVDEFLLMIHPLILGKGHRLFDATARLTKLKLVTAVTTDTGVMIATYTQK